MRVTESKVLRGVSQPVGERERERERRQQDGKMT
jgi:hypothetical protein